MLIIIEWKVDNISYDVDTIRLIMSYHHYGSKIYLLFIFNSICSKNFIFFWHSSSSSWYLWTLMIQFFLLIKIFFFLNSPTASNQGIFSFPFCVSFFRFFFVLLLFSSFIVIVDSCFFVLGSFDSRNIWTSDLFFLITFFFV